MSMVPYRITAADQYCQPVLYPAVQPIYSPFRCTLPSCHSAAHCHPAVLPSNTTRPLAVHLHTPLQRDTPHLQDPVTSSGVCDLTSGSTHTRLSSPPGPSHPHRSTRPAHIARQVRAVISAHLLPPARAPHPIPSSRPCNPLCAWQAQGVGGPVVACCVGIHHCLAQQAHHEGPRGGACPQPQPQALEYVRPVATAQHPPRVSIEGVEHPLWGQAAGLVVRALNGVQLAQHAGGGAGAGQGVGEPGLQHDVPESCRCRGKVLAQAAVIRLRAAIGGARACCLGAPKLLAVLLNRPVHVAGQQLPQQYRRDVSPGHLLLRNQQQLHQQYTHVWAVRLVPGGGAAQEGAHVAACLLEQGAAGLQRHSQQQVVHVAEGLKCRIRHVAGQVGRPAGRRLGGTAVRTAPVDGVPVKRHLVHVLVGCSLGSKVHNLHKQAVHELRQHVQQVSGLDDGVVVSWGGGWGGG
mmetsp:Transcript_19474/g.42197  ORF Transcript_19474/g.42197 Transcript_19474/m.42197 type:complete len:463 (-) Transcript_19474:588-1976(-)